MVKQRVIEKQYEIEQCFDIVTRVTCIEVTSYSIVGMTVNNWIYMET